ncbi:phage tail assembly chaperone [Sphingomonas sp. AAP5]|uniref:phage tail assembly chaperone n=1 Tax=Sphingomonas sp. AAP5 TaxID=1523415 RepID=UPI00105700B8|nr:phage tail assembly chaperone [Sphingomonas sp. AAP5]QBM77394.1 phage tail assembly chaperone [Sphingomonas sp. AAP5]
MACFADAAARLAGLAGAVLGWSPDSFWRATPAELAGVVAVLRGGDAAVDPPDAATRARLQEAFPDGR